MASCSARSFDDFLGTVPTQSVIDVIRLGPSSRANRSNFVRCRWSDPPLLFTSLLPPPPPLELLLLLLLLVVFVVPLRLRRAGRSPPPADTGHRVLSESR